ncbi:MAG: hypothetical protein KAR56_00425 [Thermoplasmata archaeon]|nr:hypothetical protein [Thermoplasmata archaeon]
MRTYLTVMFSTEGNLPSEIADRLQMIGFKPCTGNYDFVYHWDKNASLEDTIYFADKVHEVLKDMGVMFSTETDEMPKLVPEDGEF